ncbi:MAG: LssY C-terminal domain-containing protein [Planctomyces sp.]|nr:LssY C-terminal domain-containing protein [Planctomyces sp.]
MTHASSAEAPPHSRHPRAGHPHRRRSRGLRVLTTLLLAYGALAYLLIPELWHVSEDRHAGLKNEPELTHTASGIPADPVNVALIGTHDEVVGTLLAAGWHPADPITLRSSVDIAADTVFRREYLDAPVSSLYLFGRREDLAFEEPEGRSPQRRHHVRFWKSAETGEQGRPVWLGAATFDRGVGFSHTTGQITHHIAAQIDAERDRLAASLERTGRVQSSDTLPGFHTIRHGRNGGGDPWVTDGALRVLVLRHSP